MNLQDRIDKDFRVIQSRANTMFEMRSSEVGQYIEAAAADTIATVATVLSMLPELDYRTLKNHHAVDSIQRTLYRRWENAAIQIENHWGVARDDFDLLSRLAVSFVSKKSSPPWAQTQLDLKSDWSTDGDYDPRKGHIRFYFHNMVDAIVKQIQQGVLNEETLHQILARVRKFFKQTRKRRGREDAGQAPKATFGETTDPDSGDYEATMRGPANISEGTYTLEDVEHFVSQQEQVMDWEHREYKPWFSEEIKQNNRYLRDLEQILMNDAHDQLSNGMLQLGSKAQGIKDLMWVVTHTPALCDCCSKRDGMLMSDIKAKIKDQYKGLPPPLHPHCRCQLAPKLSDDWVKKATQDGDKEWEPETGIVYRANKMEKSLGIYNMTFDEYLDNIPKP